MAAHPDDIEFSMAGTLILLGGHGCDVHYMNIANGSCGSATLDARETALVRLKEAESAAALISAQFYPPIASDLTIYYEPALLAKLAAIIRTVSPDMLLLPSPEDYMEDHMNACRLGVTAAFCRGMKNFVVEPPCHPIAKDIAVYHAQPYGNRDQLNREILPEFCIDISSVMEKKRSMLAIHSSQKDWLDSSQGVNSYLDTMRSHGAVVGSFSSSFAYAEGWRRHNPVGFCPPEYDPLRDILSEYCENAGLIPSKR